MDGSDCTGIYDVVCIGGGLGGLAGAIRAHDMGAKVLVLERSEMVGGVAAYSGGWCWVGASHMAGNDTIEATEQYLDFVQGEGRPVNRQARRAYLERAVEATKWFVDAGVPLNVVRNAPDLYAPCPGATREGRLLECSLFGSDLGEWRQALRPSVYYRTGVKRDEIYHELAGDVAGRLALAARRAEDDFLTHGVGLAGGFVREALAKRGIECRLGHRVTQLSWDGQRVTGVVARGPSGTAEVQARLGVLIATGGYGNATDAAEFEDVPELVEAAPPVVDGDGLELAEAVGATVVRGADPFVVLGVRFGSKVHPGSEVPLYTQLLESIGFPHSMIVNDSGMRFGDESYYGSLIRGIRTFDGRSKRWTNYPCWLIFDEEYHRRYPIGPYLPGAEYPVEVVRRDTLGELALALGIDHEGLVSTAARFNHFATTSEDIDFGRGTLEFARRAYGDPEYLNPNLGSIDHPPFYGVRLTSLGVGLCSLGLAIDADARVLRRNGMPIEGLYATGNAAATRELKGYVTGLANARNYTYAFAAASHMAAASNHSVLPAVAADGSRA